MGRALLITGAPGSGKTTVIRALVAGFPGRAGGFITEEVRQGAQRTGFRVSALDGRQGILASRSAEPGPRVGRYRVDVATFEAVGIAAMDAAIRDADLIVVDEIGKMELCSPRFLPALEEALASPKPILGTVLQAPHPRIDALKRRPTVELYHLTERNREEVKSTLLLRLAREFPA